MTEVYCEVRQVLQSTSSIKKCESYYKVRGNTSTKPLMFLIVSNEDLPDFYFFKCSAFLHRIRKNCRYLKIHLHVVQLSTRGGRAGWGVAGVKCMMLMITISKQVFRGILRKSMELWKKVFWEYAANLQVNTQLPCNFILKSHFSMGGLL